MSFSVSDCDSSSCRSVIFRRIRRVCPGSFPGSHDRPGALLDPSLTLLTSIVTCLALSVMDSITSHTSYRRVPKRTLAEPQEFIPSQLGSHPSAPDHAGLRFPAQTMQAQKSSENSAKLLDFN
jgi:hypothetical protein